MKPDDVIYLADGSIRLRVQESGERDVLTRVETGGSVASHQGMNLPGVEALPSAVASPTSTGSTSPSTTASTCSPSRSCAMRAISTPSTRGLPERDADIPVIAKIEKREAAENAEEIVQACTGRDHGGAR